MRIFSRRRKSEFLLPPGEGQDEGFEIKELSCSDPHPSPLPVGEGVNGTAVIMNTL
jgi:hypothetical protein